jgi:hypothetical protein
MLQYKSFSENCSIFDVVLQLYGNLDLTPKLMDDNDIQDLTLKTTAGQTFVFDTDFVDNEFISNEIIRNSLNFCTGFLPIFDNNINLFLASSDVLASTDYLCSQISF